MVPVAVVEGVQQGRRADAFDGCAFSLVMDAATAAFRGRMRERYGRPASQMAETGADHAMLDAWLREAARTGDAGALAQA